MPIPISIEFILDFVTANWKTLTAICVSIAGFTYWIEKIFAIKKARLEIQKLRDEIEQNYSQKFPIPTPEEIVRFFSSNPDHRNILKHYFLTDDNYTKVNKFSEVSRSQTQPQTATSELIEKSRYHRLLSKSNDILRPSQLSTLLLQFVGQVCVCLGLFYFFYPPQTNIPISIVASSIIVLILVFLHSLYYSQRLHQQIILLGSKESNQKISEEIEKREYCRYTVAQELLISSAAANSGCSAEIQSICNGNFSGLCELSHSLGVKKIVVNYPEKRKQCLIKELRRCRLNGIEVINGNSFYEILTGKVLVDFINPEWLIFCWFRKSWLGLLVKRTTDIVLSAYLLFSLLHRLCCWWA